MMAHALAQAQVKDWRVIYRLAVEHEHGVRVLKVGNRGLERWRVQRPQQLKLERTAGP